MAFLALELLLHELEYFPRNSHRDLAPLLVPAVTALHQYVLTKTHLRLSHGTRRLELGVYPLAHGLRRAVLSDSESIATFLLTHEDDVVERAFARARSGAERRLVGFLARALGSAPAASTARAPRLRAALNLARAVGTFGLGDSNDDNDSFDGSFDGDTLEASDAAFSRLYRIFSPLAGEPSWNLRCARAMVAVYTATTPLIELDSPAAHADAVCSFFIPMLPLSLHPTAESMLRHILGQAELTLTPVAMTSASPPGFLALLLELASNLDAVVSILNEYDLNFDHLFPRRFRHYVFLVHHELAPLAVARDDDYINHVSSTVTAIVDFDGAPVSESSLVRDIVHDLHHMQFHLLPALQLTLLMRLALKEVDALHQVVKSAFSVWSMRLLDAAQLQVLCDERFLPQLDRCLSKRYLSAWYNKRMRFSLLETHAADYSEKRLAAKYFNSHWIEKLLGVARAETQSDAFRMRPILRVWKNRFLSIRSLDHQLRDYATARTLSAAFSTLRIKSEAVDSMEYLALNFYNQSCIKSEAALLKNAMAIWVRKFSTSADSPPDLLSRKLATLGKLGLSYTMLKYFRLWRGQSSLVDIAGQFEENSRTRFKGDFFSLWKFRLQSRHISASFEIQRDKRLVSNALRSWKVSVNDRKRASAFSEKSRLAAAFKLWKLNSRLKKSQPALEQRLLKSACKNWKLAVQGQLFRLRGQSMLKDKVLDTWADAYQTHLGKFASSIEVYERNLLRQKISSWVSRLDLNHELVVVANLNVQRKFLQVLIARSATHKQRSALAGQLLKDGKSFEERLMTAFYLKNWKEKYVKRYEDLSRKAADDFGFNVRNKNTLRVYFKFWNQRLRQTIKRQQLLEHRLQTSSNLNNMGGVYFYYWSERVASHRQAMEQSTSFYTTLLHKKYLLAWYEKYVAKVDYLLDVSDELRNQKDYICLLDSLRKWNLNLIKHVQRNYQTCTIFREKWERSNMKSLFQLWLHKTRLREFTIGGDDDEEYVEANTTFGSNLSPLSRKYPKVSSTSMFDTASYLHTPVKKQVQSLFTPQNRKGPSPTRLQETNQRMKIDKMDALINHYKLAKRLSNADNRLARAVRLSPPKLNNTASHMPIKPPAPRFETRSSSASPEATSSPSSSVGDPEISLLNTAKKLNKIKPLVIPPERDNEFRLTSVSKLRARFQASKGSNIEPSNVFDDTN